MKPSEFQQTKTLVKEGKVLYKIVFMDDEEGEDP